MKFKDLSDEDKLHIIATYKDINSGPWEKRAAKLGEHFGVSERTIRKWTSNKLGLKERVDIEPELLVTAKKKKHDKSKKRFIITSAQNATKVHVKFFNNLKAYAEILDAELLVIPYRYRNPTSMWNQNNETDEVWVSEVIPYLTLNRHNLNNNISILSDVKIQPTASDPLSSLEALTNNMSAIGGHPRVHMKTLPVLNAEKPKIILTTGTCTVKNYSSSKAGSIGNFHHTLGAVIVEIKDDELFFVRQATAMNDGSFCDLNNSVSDGVVTEIKDIAAYVMGDVHYGNHDVKSMERSVDEIIPTFNPKEIILHDLFDGYSINPHEANNFIKQYQNEVSNTNSLKKEINEMLNWVDSLSHLNLTVVFSNHDDFLNRFIINGDPKRNVKNALEYMEYAKILLEDKAPNGLIAYLINEKYPKVKCLNRNQSYKIKDIELGVHGMDGVNGSKGSPTQYTKLGTKIITAHAHSPSRKNGSAQVGTKTKLRLGYNNGLSTWALCDIIIHNNGKYQHLFFIGDEREYTTLL
jgi:hypothetical protein